MPLFSTPFNKSRETYYRLIGTPEDARIIIKACDGELLPHMQRRLAESEGSSIRSGSVFAWKSSSFKNWGGDGKQWGPRRDSEIFSINQEIRNHGVGLTRQFFRYENYRIMSFYSTSDPKLLLLKRPSTDTFFEAIKLRDLSNAAENSYGTSSTNFYHPEAHNAPVGD
ncbi:hypothetical protein LY78DRAFT_686664 [Colletotrichum sublineola]|nr:hypothetical protein LY78DRAFT_686664 [Colletotrichum sublineola]